MPEWHLILPAFIAGIVTFLAPCTLPLIPAYLGFVSGGAAPHPYRSGLRWRIFRNGVFYVLGFSTIFVLLGSLFGLGGQAFFAYREIFARVGGALVVLFGLWLIFPRLQPSFSGYAQLFLRRLSPGTRGGSFAFGAVFALGWTPCVGPVLGAVLTLAAARATVAEGAVLLAIFAAGLALPFLLIAAGAGSILSHIAHFSRYMRMLLVASGIILVVLGILILTGQFSLWIVYSYQLFDFVRYQDILRYL